MKNRFDFPVWEFFLIKFNEDFEIVENLINCNYNEFILICSHTYVSIVVTESMVTNSCGFNSHKKSVFLWI
jgi:hypothetical protein